MRFQKYPELFKLSQPSLHKFKSFINYFNLNLEYFKSMGIDSIDNEEIMQFLISNNYNGVSSFLHNQPLNSLRFITKMCLNRIIVYSIKLLLY
jgi:hypothetical protein